MKAHDVRKLAQCEECGGLGAMTAALASEIDAGLVIEIDGRWLHPRHVSLDALKALPRATLGELRICDVGWETMRKLLEPPTPAMTDAARPLRDGQEGR